MVNPLEGDRTRERLDALLRDVAVTGRFISAHPDVILKMGVKEVLHCMGHLGCGTDTRLYRSAEEFRDGFPAQLRSAGPRVIKQNRGNAGQGVSSLPIIWDADFLYGPKRATGEDTYVLCEINVSCVFAIPDEAPPLLLASLSTA